MSFSISNQQSAISIFSMSPQSLEPVSEPVAQPFRAAAVAGLKPCATNREEVLKPLLVTACRGLEQLVNHGALTSSERSLVQSDGVTISISPYRLVEYDSLRRIDENGHM
jgi:hypothetical protein